MSTKELVLEFRKWKMGSLQESLFVANQVNDKKKMMHKSEREINHLNFENVGHLPWIDYVIAVLLRKDLVLWLTYGHKEACRDYSKKIHDTKTSLASRTSSLKSWIYVKCYYIPLPRKVYIDICMFFYIWMSYTFMQTPYKWIYVYIYES